MRYWWVNHGQTYRQEIEGGYLWSPKRERSGNRSQFYDNLRRASPGDPILSYAAGQIMDVGRATDSALTSPKPPEFQSIGPNWDEEGWVLPVAWSRISSPVGVEPFISELQDLLPSKYSPIDRSGRGAQKAYLAEIGEAAFELTLSRCGLAGFLGNASNVEPQIDRFIASQETEVETAVREDQRISATEREQLILARRGQGRFRENVALVEPCCRLTSISASYLLVASHMKPWRSCSNSSERLDGNNGLLLAPHADLLFDRGYLSFADDGAVLFSNRINKDDLGRLGLIDRFAYSSRPFASQQLPYLAYHRTNIFLG